MMKDILLISEATIKSRTNIDDNVSGKLLLPAIRSAQEIGLRQILGDALLDKLKELAVNNRLEGYYDMLCKQAQDYLVYQSVADICLLTTVKIGNAGLEQISDEHMAAISISDSYSIQNYYQKKADYYCSRLQNWLVNNREHYPELTTSKCNQIKANLTSSASSGLWLGGLRGKSLI